MRRGVTQRVALENNPELLWFATEVGRRPKLANAILQGEGQRRGTPDGVLVFRGQVIFVELKAPRGSLSDPQKDFHRDLRAAGGRVEILYSLEQLEALLERLGVCLKASLTPSPKRNLR